MSASNSDLIRPVAAVSFPLVCSFSLQLQVPNPFSVLTATAPREVMVAVPKHLWVLGGDLD
jgi:hypothetical protein